MVARQRALTGWLFVLPALLLLAVFLIYPVLWTIRLSFDTGRGFQLTEWVGLENYTFLLTDSSFIRALGNNLQWVLLFPTLCIILGLLIAVLADRVAYERIVKSIIFLPMGIAATALALIWLFVYAPDPNIGMLNAVLTRLFPSYQPIAWVGRTETVNFAVIIAAVWGAAGFSMMVLSAALKGIPQEIIEAARVDGANEVQVFRNITLPMLSLPIATIWVTLIINVIKVFDIIYVMTAGGPRGSSRVIAYYMFVETFQSGRAGYGAAIAVIMLVLIIPIMIYNLRRFRREELVR